MGAAPGWAAFEQSVNWPSSVYWLSQPLFGFGLATEEAGAADGVALAVAEIEVIGHGDVEMLHHGAAHLRLMVVVAHGVFIGERLEIGRVAPRHVVKRHRGSALDMGGKTIGDIGVKIAQAAAWIAWRGLRDAAIGLLPHLVEAVNGISRYRNRRAGPAR